MINADNLRQILRHRVEEAGTAANFARQHGLSEGLISQVLSGRHKIGPKIARACGYRKITVFQALQEPIDMPKR